MSFILLPDFLKKKTYEVQAFIKAVQLYRQDKGYYEPWDMLIGNDVQVEVISPCCSTAPIVCNSLCSKAVQLSFY